LTELVLGKSAEFLGLVDAHDGDGALDLEHHFRDRFGGFFHGWEPATAPLVIYS
jgi:hypothetical protein